MRTALAAVGCLLAVGCAPIPNGPTEPVSPPPTTAGSGGGAPQITSFSASRPVGPSPLTTALRWDISDPEGVALVCRLDLDDNGEIDLTVTNCASTASRTRTFTGTGARVVRLSVSDGSSTATSVLTLGLGTAPADQYHITLRLGAGMTGSQIAAFESAASRWQDVLTAGEADVTINLPANACATGLAAYTGTVDDLLIDAQVVPIDGPGGILGQAGPCLIRNVGGLPAYGIMKFDSADVANLESSAQLAATIRHEMGHVLGIGTIWGNTWLANRGSSAPTFIGSAAIGSWSELGGAGGVPVENGGGSGTADSHWEESVFGNELMTGYLSGTNRMSAVTVSSLSDLGYGVDLAGADIFWLGASLRAAGMKDDDHDDHEHGHHELDKVSPIGTV